MRLPTPYYERDGITLYCGDCEQIIPLMSPVDLLLTDPPYGIGRDKGMGGRGYDGFGNRKPRNPKKYFGSWDDSRPTHETLSACIKIAAVAIIWGGNYFSDILPRSTHWLVWDKLQTMPSYSDCELAWTNSPRSSVKKFTYAQNGMLAGEKERFHPTQKPIALMSFCLRNYGGSGTIADPYSGSGTTLVAAKQLGRRAIGIEINEDYCRIAVERLHQGVLFGIREESPA